jgi:hypothetical protein
LLTVVEKDLRIPSMSFASEILDPLLHTRESEDADCALAIVEERSMSAIEAGF